jgi:hypothetical protein
MCFCVSEHVQQNLASHVVVELPNFALAASSTCEFVEQFSAVCLTFDRYYFVTCATTPLREAVLLLIRWTVRTPLVVEFRRVCREMNHYPVGRADQKFAFMSSLNRECGFVPSPHGPSI